MNLVNELQVSAESDNVVAVLRKARRLASKLERDDIAEWLQSEQSGYTDPEVVPAYRKVHTNLALNTNGPIPAGYGLLMNGVKDLPKCGLEFPFPIMASINTVLTWTAGDAKGVYFPIEAGSKESQMIRDAFHFESPYSNQITFMLHLNSSEIMAIPEHVKDKVLDWALALERAGVTGDGMSFSSKEKQIAHSVTFNIIESTIGQLSNSGTNRRIGK